MAFVSLGVFCLFDMYSVFMAYIYVHKYTEGSPYNSIPHLYSSIFGIAGKIRVPSKFSFIFTLARLLVACLLFSALVL